MAPRDLTKSDFKLALECPTKLYYKANKYPSNKSDNDFLKALAEMGLQVGELAKCYFHNEDPEDLTKYDKSYAIKKTNDLLKKDKGVIFEPVIQYKNFLLRADILIKDNNNIKLIEVKSKSFDFEKDTIFKNRGTGISKKWLKYIYDVAFQKFIIINKYPNFEISTYLMFVDKNALCPTQGLNQKFVIKKVDGRIEINGTKKVTYEDLSTHLLKQINIDEEIQYVFDKMKYGNNKLSFSEYVKLIGEKYKNNERISPKLGTVCANCEFRADKDEVKNGFKECWQEEFNFTDDDFKKPSILDLYNYKYKDKLIGQKKIFIDEINEEDIKPQSKSKSNDNHGLSIFERQCIQIKKAKNNDTKLYLDKDGLKAEIEKWKYPLHFIDFETAMPVIPFEKGAHPYQKIAFQFSHHTLDENGKVEHVDQFINTEVGVNPNIDFIRHLESSLSKDSGTIFQYSEHENRYLNYIYSEIQDSNSDLPDRKRLIKFIESIAKPLKSNNFEWEIGDRCIIDLYDLIKRYSFDPRINGSASIKKVFPSIIKHSCLLKKKYSQAIYGSSTGIKSLNFKDKAWVIHNNNEIEDPYSLLPPLFDGIDISANKIELLFDNDMLNEGGAATMAYIYIQFGEMSQAERDEIIKALKKYCELDTLAMVMLVEALTNFIKES